jgi:hypothetical protein
MSAIGKYLVEINGRDVMNSGSITKNLETNVGARRVSPMPLIFAWLAISAFEFGIVFRIDR